MSGSRVERAGGGPPGDAPRPLRRPEGQGVTDGRPSPVALRRAAVERRGALLKPAHSATRAKQKGGPKLVGRTGSPCCIPQATLNAVARVILAKPARAGQHPAGAAPRGSAPEPAPTSAAAAVGQARRDGAPAAAALPARPGASLDNLPRLAGLLSGRSTPKSCTTTLLFRPRSFSGRHAKVLPEPDADPGAVCVRLPESAVLGCSSGRYWRVGCGVEGGGELSLRMG